MRDDRYSYWPRQFEELVSDPIPASLVNEPAPPDNVAVMPARQRSLYAVLCEALMNTQAVLTRLEAGITVPRAEQREIVRLLYVATRHQRDALVAVLELDGIRIGIRYPLLPRET